LCESAIYDTLALISISYYVWQITPLVLFAYLEGTGGLSSKTNRRCGFALRSNSTRSLFSSLDSM